MRGGGPGFHITGERATGRRIQQIVVHDEVHVIDFCTVLVVQAAQRRLLKAQLFADLLTRLLQRCPT